MKTLMYAVSVAALASAPALAQQADLFSTFDANGDGVVTQEEFALVSPAFTPQVYADLDLDASGDIVVEELGASPLLSSFRYYNPTRFRREAPRIVSRYSTYQRLDRNGDGFLSAGELSAGLPTVNRTRYINADINGDGVISFNELYGWRHFTRLEETGALLLPEEAADDATFIHDRVRYTRVDLNRDGAISMSELLRIAPDATLAEYAVIDANDDGVVTYRELYAAEGVMDANIEEAMFVIPEADAETTTTSAATTRTLRTYPLDSYTFSLADTDNDFFLSADELRMILPDLSDDEFLTVDLDADGVVRYREFYSSPSLITYRDAGRFVYPTERTVTIERSYFTGIDRNGNGVLEADELTEVSPTMSETVYPDVDLNQDGVVTYDELYRSGWFSDAVANDSIITPTYSYRYYTTN